MTTERRALGPVGTLMGPELGVLPAGRMSFPLESSVHAPEMCFSVCALEMCFSVCTPEMCFSVCAPEMCFRATATKAAASTWL